MFRSVDNRYFQSQNQMAKCLHLWHFWFILSNPEDEHGWPPREFFMVDGIGSPHCADIATGGRYRQFPWEQWTANRVRGGFPSQYDMNHIGQWHKWLRKKVRSRRTQESSAQWNENDVTFDSEVRCLVLCLKPDTSADNVCIGDKQFFGPGEVL